MGPQSDLCRNLNKEVDSVCLLQLAICTYLSTSCDSDRYLTLLLDLYSVHVKCSSSNMCDVKGKEKDEEGEEKVRGERDRGEGAKGALLLNWWWWHQVET
jgi:hypothetical protein